MFSLSIGRSPGFLIVMGAAIIGGAIVAGARTAQAEPAGQTVEVQSYGSVDVSELPPATSNTSAWKAAPRKFPDSNALAQLKQSYHGAGAAKPSKPGGRHTNTPTPTATRTPTPTATPTATPSGGPTPLPTPSASFSGLQFTDSGGWVPPDTQVAAGPTQLVEAVNLEMRITDKTGHSASDISLNSLFATSAQLSDPRVLYDSDSGRWYIETITVPSGSGAGSWNLAVSNSSDAAGGFKLYSFQTVGSFPDFPKIGINENKVVLSGDAFSGNSFLGTEYLVLSKANLTSCSSTPCAASAWYYPPDQGLFAIEPAQHLQSPVTPANDNLYMAAVAYNTASSVRVWAVQGVPNGGPAPVQPSKTLALNRALNSPPNAAQCNSSKTVVTNDNALLNAAFRDGSSAGHLWVSAADACVPPGDTTARACARFTEISIAGDDLTTASVAQDFDVAQAGFHYYYPAATISSNGDMVAVFSGSSSSVCPGVYAVEQFAGSPPSLSNVQLVQGATYPYTQANRWGDYSGIGIDPVDDETAWITGEYSSNYSCAPFLCSGWGTWIANIPAP